MDPRWTALKNFDDQLTLQQVPTEFVYDSIQMMLNYKSKHQTLFIQSSYTSDSRGWWHYNWKSQ